MKPKTYTTDLANLPEALARLTQQPRWVLWYWEQRQTKNSEPKWTKPPRQPCGSYAHNGKPETWSPYSAVVSAMNGADGIGYQLLGDRIAAIDLDGCRDEARGSIDPCVDQATTCGAYVEISPSGTGLHIIGLSDKGALQSKYAVNSTREKAGAEIYRNVDTGRYICITGCEVGKSADLTNIDPVLDRITNEYGQQPNVANVRQLNDTPPLSSS